jgi:hypothetical protein
MPGPATVPSYVPGRKTRALCASRKSHPVRAAGTRSARRVVGHLARRRAAAMPDLDIVAAGISLSISELWQRLPSVA